MGPKEGVKKPDQHFKDLEVTLIVEPTDPDRASFTAAGLTLGGRHVWRFEHRFNGLVVP